MDIESIFAAAVFNAPKAAAEMCKHGIRQTTSDQISCALADLWQFDGSRAQAIADKYVWYDADGEPQQRTDIDWGNVVALRSTRPRLLP
jgi:hypothetical protein